MTHDNFDSVYIVAAVIGLATAAAVATGRGGHVPLNLSPVPAATVTIPKPCVFLAYDPGLNAYVCLDKDAK